MCVILADFNLSLNYAVAALNLEDLRPEEQWGVFGVAQGRKEDFSKSVNNCFPCLTKKHPSTNGELHFGLLVCSTLHKRGEDEIISWRKPRMLIKEMAFWHSFLARWSSQPSWYFMFHSRVESFPVWFFLYEHLFLPLGVLKIMMTGTTWVFDTGVFSQSDPELQLSKPAVSRRAAWGSLWGTGSTQLPAGSFHAFLPHPRGGEVGSFHISAGHWQFVMPPMCMT